MFSLDLINNFLIITKRINSKNLSDYEYCTVKPYLNTMTQDKLNETFEFRSYTKNSDSKIKFNFEGKVYDKNAQAAVDMIMIIVISSVVGLAIIGKNLGLDNNIFSCSLSISCYGHSHKDKASRCLFIRGGNKH